jgi:hypothetical protein
MAFSAIPRWSQSMPRVIKTAAKPQSAAPATQTAIPHVNGSPHPPASVAALPHYDPRTVAFGGALGTAHEKPPAVPHTTRLLIVRAPGGYTLFDADWVGRDEVDTDPAEVIAVASTADDLVRRIRDWTAAQPTAEG